MLEEMYDLGMDLEEYFEYIYNHIGKDKDKEIEIDFFEGLEEQRQESTLTF